MDENLHLKSSSCSVKIEELYFALGIINSLEKLLGNSFKI